MQKIKSYPAIFRIFIFIAPITLWCFIFRKFLSGENSFGLDTFAYYGMYKFYFNNIINGTFPLWDPFTFLGRPFYLLASFNFFNPTSFLMLICLKLGLNYHLSFIVMMLFYLFLGHIGFYYLVKSLLKNKFLAYLGFLIMLFSGVSAIVFNQPNMLLMYTPCVWIFYFFIEFSRQPQKKFFYGVIFCWMVLLTSYLPFYFFTLLGTFLFMYLLLYFSTLPSLLSSYGIFFRKNIPTLLIGIFSLAIALIPGYLYKTTHNPNDIVNPARHCCCTKKQDCLDSTMTSVNGQMSLSEIAKKGTLAERISFHELFSNLDKMLTIPDHMFFLPVFVYLMIVISALQPLRRPTILLGFVFTIIMLISLGYCSPVHEFLYKWIPYFHYFRNLFFLMVYLMPILTLIALYQLKDLLEKDTLTPKSTLTQLIAVIALHLAFLFFLIHEQYIIMISYVTVAASCLFWIGYYTDQKQSSNHRMLQIALCILIVPQAIYVFSSYNARAFHHCPLPKNHTVSEFSFHRPIIEDRPTCLLVSSYSFYYNLISKDMSGYIDAPDSVNRWIFYLSYKIGEPQLIKYTQNKFIFYDHIQSYDESSENLDLLRPTFEHFANLAFISEPDTSINLSSLESEVSEYAQTISSSSNQLAVTKFTVNELVIKTTLPKSKFLVYADGFNQFWKAYLDGRPTKLYRANLGFKGVLLPEGTHTITMQFEPPGRSWIYITLIIYFHVFFIAVVCLFFSKPLKIHEKKI